MSAAKDRVAVGGRYNDANGSNSGHVRIYDWNGSTWNQAGQDIDHEAAYDSSGFLVAMSAPRDRVAIGAHGNDGNGFSNSGHVQIYNWNVMTWNQTVQNIDGGEANWNYSGWSVDGKGVAIGAVGSGNPELVGIWTEVCGLQYLRAFLIMFLVKLREILNPSQQASLSLILF
jgi:hypothetical protein